MIRGKLYRAEIFDNSKPPYKTLDEVYAVNKDRYPGKRCYVSNGHWFGPKNEFVGNYKVGGVVLCAQYADCIGMAWSGFERPVMGWWSKLKTKDNFLCTMPVLMNGVEQDVSAARYKSKSVVRTCAVTGFGFFDNGDMCLDCGEVISTAQLQKDRKAAGIVDYLRLDSGTSCQGKGPDLYVKPLITVYSFLIVWLEPEETQAADDTDDLQVIDTGLKFAYALTPRTTTNLMVLHHVGAGGSFTVEQIHAEHLAKGWAGIAYHYYVRRDGTIYRGRPENVIGGHTLGYNSTSIGICAEGNFETETMPDVQKAALKALVADVLTRYPGLTIKRHCDLNATACPGKNYPFAAIAGVTTSLPATTDPKDYVKAFQTWLNSRYGYGLALDGIYGAKTRAAAVKAYQQLVGVTADGVFGPITKAASGSLGYGSTGTGVYILQGLLYGNGIDPNGFDGKFGTGTQRAVMDYQALKGLTVDGIAGRNTLEALMK